MVAVLGSGLPWCPTKLSIAVIKHCYQSNSVREEHSVQAGTWWQELIQRPWRGAAYWFAPKGSHCFLLKPRTSFSKVALAPVGRALPYQSLIQKMLAQICNLFEIFSHLRFLFLDSSSLCQVDKNKQTNKKSKPDT